MTVLLLYTNSLTWTLPTNIGSLSNLEILALKENLISGTIPSRRIPNSGIGDNIGLVRNEPDGSILPSELGQLTTKSSLYYVLSNAITGAVPLGYTNNLLPPPLGVLKDYFGAHNTLLTGGLIRRSLVW
jgi:hypothetical protein